MERQLQILVMPSHRILRFSCLLSRRRSLCVRSKWLLQACTPQGWLWASSYQAPLGSTPSAGRGKVTLLWRVQNPGTVKVVVGSSAGLDVDSLLATASDSAAAIVDLVNSEIPRRTLKIKGSAADELFLSGGTANARQEQCDHEGLSSHAQ